MRFGILGPVTVDRDGGRVRLAAPMVRGLLGVLLLDAGRPVPDSRLVEVLWRDAPPASAKASLHNHVSRLRRVLGTPDSERVRRTLDGYLIEIGPGELDLREFEELRRRGDEALETERWQAGADALSEALALWRGDLLADVPPAVRDTIDVDDVEEARLQTVEQLAHARLRLGRFDRVVTDLGPLVRDHPWREAAHGQLMHALHGAGRQADALALYQELRARLVSELGVEPSAAVAQLHLRILAADPALTEVAPPTTAPATVPTTAPTVRTEPESTISSRPDVPNQLPPRAEHFTGRDATLAALTGMLGAESTRSAHLVAIVGTAGVGKTALAVQWAAEIAGRFPDGCLYVNLRGFDPAGTPPVTPEQAIRGFLHALGVPAQEVPAGLADQTGLFRSRLAGRRVLVVLDNARDAEHVRPLLPGAPGCLTVVTSRDRLTGLVAVDGARPVPLDLLTPEEAAALLVRRLDGDSGRSAPSELAELAEIAEVAELCARLPLALNIAAARIATTPHLPLAVLAKQLRETDERLTALDVGDPAADVRGVLSWSYRQSSPDAARLFRLLGLHPGPDITAAAAASLAALPVRRVRALLAELVGAHLVAESAAGRYTFHDLLRAYAREQALDTDDDRARGEATHRMLDHYLHTACRALRLVSPHQLAIDPAPAAPGTLPEDLAGDEEAQAWYQAEHEVLPTAVGVALEAGLDAHAWQLTWAIVPYLGRREHHYDMLGAELTALEAAERAGDRPALARTHRLTAQTCVSLGQLQSALSHAMDALGLAVELGDALGEAGCHRALASIHLRQSDEREALRHTRRAHDIFAAAGYRPGEAWTTDETAYLLIAMGEHGEALTYAEQALAMHQELGEGFGEATAWENIGTIRFRLGDYGRAVDCHRRSAKMYADLGAPAREASVLCELADAQEAGGDHAAARESRETALAIYEALGDPRAVGLRDELQTA